MSSDTMKLALQLTATEMMSGVLNRAKQHILSLGQAGQAVARDFDQMNAHITKGLQGVAVSLYGVRQLAKGIAPAADLQESMIDVHMSLMRSGKSTKVLNAELAKVRATAVELQKITPFSAQDVVDVQKELLNSGLEFEKVVGRGATRAAVMLATITKETPQAAADAMLNIGIPYDLKSDEYTKVADVIQRHVMSGRMKLPDLNTNLKYVTGVAKNMKVPWDDLLTGMAVLGEQGMAQNSGIEMKDFLVRMTGSSREERRIQAALNQYLKSQGKAPLKFWDDAGKLKQMHTIIKEMRVAFSGMSDEKKSFVLQKIFEQRGNLAAIALMKEGTGSWEFIKEKVEAVASAEDKMNERLKGFNANVTALGGTTKTTLATLFDPMLGGLTEVTKKLNDMVDLVGQLAAKHPDLTKSANYMAGGAVVAAGGYGLYHLLKGGIAGGRVLKGIGGIKGLLKGAGGTALGVAEGKAIQAATGVQPVFITNWPGGFASGANTVAEVAAGAAGGSVLKKMAVKAGILASGVMPWVAGRGLPVAAMTAASAGGGYLVGTGINQGLGKLSGMLSNGQYGGDGWLGSRAYDLFHPDQGRETKNDINLSIAIDGNNRVVTQTSDPNTHTRINTMRRGSFTPALASSH